MQTALWFLGAEQRSVWASRDDIPLSTDELARAQALRFATDRTNFVASRRFVHYVLAQHLGVATHEVTVSAALGERPCVDAPRRDTGLRFSLSRSHGHTLVGVASDHAIGVDLETMRPLDDLQSLVATALSDRERSDWLRVPEAQRLAAFYTTWTRKEALGKARATGIGAGPKQLAVPVGPLSPHSGVALQTDSDARRWLFCDAAFGSRLCASVVIDARNDDASGYSCAQQVFTGPADVAPWPDTRLPAGAQLIVLKFSDAP